MLLQNALVFSLEGKNRPYKVSREKSTIATRSACLLHFSTDKVPLDEQCASAIPPSLDTKWEFSSVPEVVELDCIRCEGQVLVNGQSTDSVQNNNEDSTLKLAPITLNDERPPGSSSQSIVDITNFHNADILKHNRHRQVLNPQGMSFIMGVSINKGKVHTCLL
uniref:Uncharacterized protein n=1 Tax=Ditylenchus dipsaci TaxID=166011 RepID=A0A915CV72_9BILA